MARNPYLPYPARIEEVVVENEARDIKTFRLAFEDPADAAEFQVPARPVRRTLPAGRRRGAVSGLRLRRRRPATCCSRSSGSGSSPRNSTAWSRAPASASGGRWEKPFPWDRMAGKNLLIIGGGFAFTTLRAVISTCPGPRQPGPFRLGPRRSTARARPANSCTRQELAEWQKRDDIDVHLTVDKADEGWNQHVGVVTAVLEKLKPRARTTPWPSSAARRS